MQHPTRLLLVVCLLGVGAVGVGYWRMQQNGHDATELVIYGNVDVRQMELAINGSERIVELTVDEGDQITKGQLLAKLNTERLEYAVARAKAIVESQRQVVARLEAGSRVEEIAPRAKNDVLPVLVFPTDGEAIPRMPCGLADDKSRCSQISLANALHL